jgi:hypothetical protein
MQGIHNLQNGRLFNNLSKTAGRALVIYLCLSDPDHVIERNGRQQSQAIDAYVSCVHRSIVLRAADRCT